MRRGWDDNRHGIDFVEEPIERWIRGDLVLRGHLRRAPRVFVNESCEALTAQVAQNADMVHTESTCADHADARGAGPGKELLFRCEVHGSEPNAALTGFDEREEMLDLGNLLELAPRPLDTLREVEVGSEAEPIGLLELAHNRLGESAPLQSH